MNTTIQVTIKNYNLYELEVMRNALDSAHRAHSEKFTGQPHGLQKLRDLLTQIIVARGGSDDGYSYIK